MTETLRRDEFIAILNRLGSDEDEEALQAARQAHARISASGMSWEELLVPDEPAAENDEPAVEPAEEPTAEPVEEPPEEPADEPPEEPADESDETGDRELEAVEDEAVEDESPAERAGAEGTEKDAESLAKRAGKDTESLALIGELLARSNISEELRAELEDYKTDIAENEFTEPDRRYLRAIRKRLSKYTKSR